MNKNEVAALAVLDETSEEQERGTTAEAHASLPQNKTAVPQDENIPRFATTKLPRPNSPPEQKRKVSAQSSVSLDEEDIVISDQEFQQRFPEAHQKIMAYKEQAPGDMARLQAYAKKVTAFAHSNV